MTTRAFHVYIVDGNNFTVVDDDGAIAHYLCWDEMLGCIAEASHPTIRPVHRARFLCSPDELVYRMQQWRQVPINEIR